MYKSRLFLSLGLLGLFSFQALPAWDAVGHMMVAKIAYGRLQPSVKAKLAVIAAQIQYPGRQYTASTMAVWMDDIRTPDPHVPFDGKFKPFHFIDLGMSPSDPLPSLTVTNPTDEASGNVVQALKRATAVVRGGTDPLIPNKVVALSLIVHLVGDIHQPLHCATYFFPTPEADGKPDLDAGGNRVTVTDSPEDRSGGLPPHKLNLHSFWDEAYRAGFQNGNVALAPLAPYGTPHHASEMDPYLFDFAAYAPGRDVSLKTDFDGWMRESHRLAREDIYGVLPFDSKHRNAVLSRDYVEKSKEVARHRIVLAGYRLAQLLNDLLGDQASASTATVGATHHG